MCRAMPGRHNRDSPYGRRSRPGPTSIPTKQKQAGAGTAPGVDAPQGHCINDTTTSTIAGVGCWRLLFGGQPPHDEVISTPDANDTRMQHVMYANGKL